MTSSKQLSVHITFQVKPDHVEEWRAAHRPVLEACAKEPKCLFFDMFRGSEDNAGAITFRFIEVWDADRKWFEEEQMTKPYYAEMFPKSQLTWAAEPKIEYFEREGDAMGVAVYGQRYLDGGKKMN